MKDISKLRGLYRFPDGQVVLQAGYTVNIGFAYSYIKWVPMEIVDVSEDGLTESDREAMARTKKQGK